MSTRCTPFGLVFVVSILLATCESTHPVADDLGDSVSSQGTASSCGGFPSEPTVLADFFDSLDYCTTERLHWTFDTTFGVLTLWHTRKALNCSARLQPNAIISGDTIHLDEIDLRYHQANDPAMISTCMCTFSTCTKLQHVEAGMYTVRVTTEAGNPASIRVDTNFAKLDLSSADGALDIQSESLVDTLIDGSGYMLSDCP